jgi:hypothetical protein
MGKGWEITFTVLGILIALFAIAIDHYPKDVWQHMLAWWGIFASGIGIATTWLIKMAMGSAAGSVIGTLIKRRVVKNENARLRQRRR